MIQDYIPALVLKAFNESKSLVVVKMHLHTSSTKCQSVGEVSEFTACIHEIMYLSDYTIHRTTIFKLDIKNLKINLKRNSYIFIQENTFENVV